MENNLFVSGIRLKGDIPQDNYLYDLPVIKNVRQMGELSFKKPITFFVGENGIGKSTIIEAIAVKFGFNPEGGTKNYNFHTKSTHSILCEYMTLIKTCNFAKSGYFLRAESLYNAISYYDYTWNEQLSDNDYFDTLRNDEDSPFSLHTKSHGESFLRTIEDFRPNGLYILDEPEAALSPNGIMKLMCHMDRLIKKGCQFIVSTHSPILITMPNSDIYQLTKDKIELVDYTQTEHFIITRKFLNNPNQMLNYLLKD
ncbi:MAG: AAA family ATPase [Clostridia bacterium]|nr:AAA family ATPase [Clostridia bacterium]